MAYRVRIDSFEGPFDLLLYLVSRQKVDIGSISITQIVDQYLAYVERMRELDLDVASDFLLVASTLLEIKAASLVPHEAPDEAPDEWEDLTPDEARDILIERLIAYKKYKNASAALGARFEPDGPPACAHGRPRPGIFGGHARLPQRRDARFACVFVRFGLGAPRGGAS